MTTSIQQQLQLLYDLLNNHYKERRWNRSANHSSHRYWISILNGFLSKVPWKTQKKYNSSKRQNDAFKVNINFKKDSNWFLIFFFPLVPSLHSQLPLVSNKCHLGKRGRSYVDNQYWTKCLSGLDDLICNYSEDQLYTILSGHKTDQIIFLYMWYILVLLMSFLFLVYFLCINDTKNVLS